MKHPALLSLLFLLVCCCSACQHGEQAETSAYDAVVASTTDTTVVTAPAATSDPGTEAPLQLNDPARKIIKTADLRCRVDDVLSATMQVERLAQAVGVQISQSHLNNETSETKQLPYKTDSLKQVSAYLTTSRVTLRIPVQKLDTVLSQIAANAAFVNSRNLSLDDVTLRYLSNKLKNDAMAQNDAALRASRLARKTKDAVYSSEYTDNRNENRIDRQIENLQLNDQVHFATLSLELYQPQRISYTIVPNVDYLMQPGMGQQLQTALATGWSLLCGIITALVSVWPLLLMLLIALLVYRLRRGKRPLREAIIRA